MSSARLTTPIFINGRFLMQHISGVQRYGREFLRALDDELESDKHDDLAGYRWIILLPKSGPELPFFNRIETHRVGNLSGHLWEQLILPWAARSGPLLSLTNGGPVCKRDQLVVLHDAAVFRAPENFGWAYRTLHRLLSLTLGQVARIATVSSFSRSELSSLLHISEKDILIAFNGSEHILGGCADDGSVQDLPTRFFLTVGNQTPSKNISIVLEALALSPTNDIQLVVVGHSPPRVFGRANLQDQTNVRYLGRVSDDDLAELYLRARALIFPSRYEGFGIPLLEAMTIGCPIIASSIPSSHEVCGQYAVYFDVDDAAGLRAVIETFEGLDGTQTDELRVAGRARASKFSWRSTALTLAHAMTRI